MSENRGVWIVFAVVLLLGMGLFFLGFSLTGNVIINSKEYVAEIAINSCEDLQNIRSTLGINNYYYLNQSINCSGVDNFIPIGNSINSFNATFDGKGHSISNVTFSDSDLYLAGIFGFVTNANIFNLSLQNINISGTQSVGGLCGNTASSNFSNVDLVNVTINGTEFVGGLIGYSSLSFFSNVSIINMSILGEKNVGGVVGYFSINPTEIKNIEIYSSKINCTSSVCSNIGGLIGNMQTNNNGITILSSSIFNGNISVNSGEYIGGLIGYSQGNLNREILIKNSSSSINLIGTSNYTGGLIGYGVYSIITSSYSIGSINGNGNVGGLVGRLNNSVLNNSFSNSTIYASGIYSGGLVGLSNGNINSSYYNGTLNGTNYVGGVVGYNLGIIENIYSETIINGTNYVGGVVGYNNGSLINSYSSVVSVINGTDYVGGVVGYNNNTVKNVIYLGNISGNLENSAHVIGYSNVNYESPNSKISNFMFYNRTGSTIVGVHTPSGVDTSGLITGDNNESNFYNYTFSSIATIFSDDNVWVKIFEYERLPVFRWQYQCKVNSDCSGYYNGTGGRDYLPSCYNLKCIDAKPAINVSSETPKNNVILLKTDNEIQLNFTINSLKFFSFNLTLDDKL